VNRNENERSIGLQDLFKVSTPSQLEMETDWLKTIKDGLKRELNFEQNKLQNKKDLNRVKFFSQDSAFIQLNLSSLQEK